MLNNRPLLACPHQTGGGYNVPNSPRLDQTPSRCARPLALLLLLVPCLLGCNSKKPPTAQTPAAPPPQAISTKSPASTADRYRALWQSWPADWMVPAALLHSDSAIPRFDPGNGIPTPSWTDFSRVLKEHDADIRELIAITSEPKCNLELKPSDDLQSEYTRFGGYFRNALRLLRADAARCWQAGDMDGCTDRLAAMFGLADHLAQQKSVLASLVGEAVIGYTCTSVNAFIAETPAASFKPAHATKLLKAMDRLNPDDLSGITAAKKAEGNTDPIIGASTEKTREAWDTTRKALTEHAK
jgi:hypothetical protein